MKSLKSLWTLPLRGLNFMKECIRTLNNLRLVAFSFSFLYLLNMSLSLTSMDFLSCDFMSCLIIFCTGLVMILHLNFFFFFSFLGITMQHDVFLISENAMHFNSTSTIYFRQVFYSDSCFQLLFRFELPLRSSYPLLIYYKALIIYRLGLSMN